MTFGSENMIIGFAIWTVCCAMIIGIGVSAWRTGEKVAVGFFTGLKTPEVKDVKKYNRAVAILWFVYAGVIEVLGVPLLFIEQNSIVFVPIVFGGVIATIGLMVVYLSIEKKYKK